VTESRFPDDRAGPKRLIIDTDTAGDDTQAILYAAYADRVDLEALTIVSGNVEFDYEVENAKYTLDLAEMADSVPVYEGAREPLMKDHDFADYVHGEGGLGGDLFPDTGIVSADDHAVDAVLDAVRSDPGEVSLLCIGPLTNVALACVREPDLNDLVDEVWVMGGAANCLGNVTPAAEYNFWVDPDAAKIALDHLDVTLVDWGLTARASVLDAEDFDRIETYNTEEADFFLELTTSVREYTRESIGVDGTTQPDSLAAAAFVYPELIEEAGVYHADVDEREGMTRGYSMVDEDGVTDGETRTRVIERVDADAFGESIHAMLREADPGVGLSFD
jgi:purine nucleosidase